MKIKILSEEFSVCQVEDLKDVNLQQKNLFLAVTDDEISVVCSAENVPSNAIAVEGNWRALKIEGVLDFSLVGILSKIANALANESISIFAISTYNTDYILVKSDRLETAKQVLEKDGYQFV